MDVDIQLVFAIILQMSYNRLLGKRIVVTGGGSGIGRAMCKLFGREGAQVAIVDVDKTGAEQTHALLQDDNLKQKHCVVAADVRNVEDINATFETVYEAFGQKPNVLVNNAAIIRGGIIDAVSEDQLDDVLNIDLKAVYLMSKYFISSVKGSGEPVNGNIVNIASMAGKLGMAASSDYAAAKAGVIGLTKSIALEFRWHKVRCNALLPGFTDTPMAANSDQIVLEKIIHQAIPMKRLARPDEIANACLFLASDDSSYVNGASLEVSGGL